MTKETDALVAVPIAYLTLVDLLCTTGTAMVFLAVSVLLSCCSQFFLFSPTFSCLVRVPLHLERSDARFSQLSSLMLQIMESSV